MGNLKGDNRWTAILSMDLVGFTEISHRIGSERVYALLVHVMDIAHDAIQTHGGHVVDTAGDGILAAFGAPNALENAALQSCRAALDFQNRIEAERASLEAQFKTNIQFRIGIGGGNTMVAKLPNEAIKVIGLSVNKAARLEALAAPGETLISETIWRETQGFVKTLPRGTAEIKGFDQPVGVHALQGLVRVVSAFGGTQRQGLTQLISRKTELGQIRDCLERRASFVVVRGPAGIGKSRLLHEVVATDPRISLIGQCAQAAQATPYAPIIEMFRQATNASWTEERADVLQRLLARYPDVDPSAITLAQADGVRHQSTHALDLRDLYWTLLQRVSDDTNCILVVEDIQWADPASRALFDMVAQSELAILTTMRSDAENNWLAGKSATVIDLAPLDRDAIARIAQVRLGGRLTPDLNDLIGGKAEGIPLMAEEIARALEQDKRLAQTTQGLALVGDTGMLLTGNLEHLVLSRVDRLSSAQKDTLHVASGIGRVFRPSLLEAALGRPAKLQDIAKHPGLIEQTGPDRWQFVHALIRDAVFGSMLTATRQDAQGRIAQAIETSPLPFDPATLAAHFLQSADPGKAVPHLVHAARESLAVYALHEANTFLGQAMELIERDPKVIDDATYQDMAVLWLRTTDNMGDFALGLSLSKRLSPRLEASGYSPALSITRMLTALALAHTWQYGDAQALAEATLREAEAQGDRQGAAWAKAALIRIFDESKSADLATIEQHVAEIEPVAQDTDDRQLAMTAYYLLSSAYRSCGAHRKAFAVISKIEAFGETHNDQRAYAYANWARALIFSIEGDLESAHRIILQSSGHFLPGSGDARVSEGIACFSGSFLHPHGTYTKKILDLADEARKKGDLNIFMSMELTAALAAVRAGDLATGWACLSELATSIPPKGNLNLAQQVLITQAEILLSIRRLIDPQAEAPDRSVFPRKRLGLRDMATFVRLRMTALGLAEAALMRCLTLCPNGTTAHYARCKINLGLIRAHQGRHEEAAKLLRTGLAKARDEGLQVLIKRGESALDALDG